MTELQGEALDMRNVNTCKVIPVTQQHKKNIGRRGGINKCQKFFPGFSQGIIFKIKTESHIYFQNSHLNRCSSKIMWISQLSCNRKAEFRKRLNGGVSKANADTPDCLNVCLIKVALGQDQVLLQYFLVALQNNIRISRILLAFILLIACSLSYVWIMCAYSVQTIKILIEQWVEIRRVFSWLKNESKECTCHFLSNINLQKSN